MGRNPYLCLTIVVMLGLGGFVGLLGMIFLAYNNKSAPEALIAVCSASWGSLASFLVMPPRGSVGFNHPEDEK